MTAAAGLSNFTKASIDGVSSPLAGRLVLRDAKVVGLELRVTANGAKTFSVRRRVRGGRPERVTIGRYPEVTIDQARRMAASIMASLANGKSVADDSRERREELTFGQLFDEYLVRHARPNKRTWKEDAAKFAMHLEKHIGAKKLSSITRRDIAEIHSKLTLAKQPTTANRVLALVSSIYGWASSAGLWASNPAAGVKRNKEDSRDRFLQADELPLFFAALAAESNHTVRDFVLISLLTGARRANVLAMRWSEVSLERGEWRIERTKNDDPQTVNLSTEALQILVSRQADRTSDFVFPGTGKSGHFKEPVKGWRRILDRAGALAFVRAVGAAARWQVMDLEAAEQLAFDDPTSAVEAFEELGARIGVDPQRHRINDLRIHDLRRTLGSWQAKMGASLTIIGKSLNHRNVATTAIYARLDQDPVRQSVQSAASAIMQVGRWNDARSGTRLTTPVEA